MLSELTQWPAGVSGPGCTNKFTTALTWTVPAQTLPSFLSGFRNTVKDGLSSTPYKPGVGSSTGTNRPTTGNRSGPGNSMEKTETVRSLEVQLQRMIDDELAAAVPSSVTDPDEAISRHMEASLKLWNKLTEIRNNYKTELKKKQEERVSFENDIRAATAQTTAELALVERDLDRTNQEISAMETQIVDAENYQKKIDEETHTMEEELKSFAVEDDALQKELSGMNKAIQTVEASISQAETDYCRHKSDAEKELTLVENSYSKEIEAKDQQIAVSIAELEQLEHDLSEFGRSNPQELEIMHLREEVQRMKMENDMIHAEINQIHQSNIELRRNGENLLAAGEGKLRKEQLANEAEGEKMAQEIQCLEKKLRAVEEHVRHLEQQRSQLDKQTADTEKEIEGMQSDIQSTKQQLQEKEKAMKEMCELFDKQEMLEQEMEEKYEEDVHQLERQTDNKIRDIKNQMMACAKKKQDNMAKIRGICQEIKDLKEKLKQAEINAQDTFKKLRCLTEEYEMLRKQNERSEEFIAFYNAIRSYETKYVDLKSALSRAKNQQDFVAIRGRERLKDDASPPFGPKSLQRQARSANRARRYGDETEWRDMSNSSKRQTGHHQDQPRPRDHRRSDTSPTVMNVDVDMDISCRSAIKDPLADPFIQAYLKVNRIRSASRKCR